MKYIPGTVAIVVRIAISVGVAYGTDTPDLHLPSMPPSSTARISPAVHLDPDMTSASISGATPALRG